MIPSPPSTANDETVNESGYSKEKLGAGCVYVLAVTLGKVEGADSGVSCFSFVKKRNAANTAATIIIMTIKMCFLRINPTRPYPRSRADEVLGELDLFSFSIISFKHSDVLKNNRMGIDVQFIWRPRYRLFYSFPRLPMSELCRLAPKAFAQVRQLHRKKRRNGHPFLFSLFRQLPFEN